MAIAEITVDKDAKRLFKVVGEYNLSKKQEKEIEGIVKDIKSDAARNAAAIMMCDLYDLDGESLKGDMAKVVLLDSNKDVRAEPSERIRLLQILWWIVTTYFEGDDGMALKKCMEFCSHPRRR